MTKLLIVPYINGKPHGYAVQAEKFSLDLEITNLGDNPSNEFTIFRIALKSSEGQDFVEDFGKKTFFVGIINPGQSQVINIAHTGQFMYGLADLRVQVAPMDTAKTITFFQKNSFTNENTEIGPNTWVDFLYIKSANQASQEKNNKWIMILTWAAAVFTFIQILPIIQRIYNFIF